MGNCTWTTQRADARDFDNIERALQVIIHDKLDGMSLVIRHDESDREQEFNLSCDFPDVNAEGKGLDKVQVPGGKKKE